MPNTVLVFLVLSLVASLLIRRKAPAIGTPLVALLVAATLVAVTLKIVRSMRASLVPASQLDIVASAALKLGQAVAEDIPGGGAVIVVHAPVEAPLQQEMLGAQMSALRRGLGSGFSVEASAFVPVESDAPPSIPPLAGEAVRRALETKPDAVAVVSLAGSVSFGRDPPAAVPPLYLFGGGASAAGTAVRAVVATREDADWKAEPPPRASPDEIFALRYELIRPPAP